MAIAWNENEKSASFSSLVFKSPLSIKEFPLGNNFYYTCIIIFTVIIIIFFYEADKSAQIFWRHRLIYKLALLYWKQSVKFDKTSKL